IGVPYSQLIRDFEPPYENIFRDVRVGGRFVEKVGEADAVLQGTLLSGPRLNVPLAARGVRPEDAELKIGQLYLDLNAISGSLLYSDNINLRERDRRDGLIGILRLTSTIVFQIADAVRLATRGTLVYLPFRGKVGIAGFGIDDPLIEFQTMPLFQAQLTLDQRVAGWDVEVVDDLSVRHRRFDAGLGLDVFDGATFDEEDRAGRYIFRDHTLPPSPGFQDNRVGRLGYNFIQGRNLIGASATRYVFGDTRLEFGGYHADYWYAETRDRRLPRSRDTVYAMLVNERESLRFKPFARYRASHYDISPGWGQEARVGVHGPVTENMALLADVGYYWRTDSSRSTYLARLRLRHSFNPITFHQLEYHRSVAEPQDEIADTVSYLLHHLFREDLFGRFYLSYATFENARGGRRTGEEYRAAARLNYDLAQRTSLRLSGAFVDFENRDPLATDFEDWIGRAELLYRHTADLHAHLIYQYRDRHADAPGRSYRENLILLTLIKYF
ncbi:MAG: hypothetical protein RMK20_04805, partial [Verrucomicrobiales bacterium]|nr:hypothetical protein [Verrucomicrobiales bacterium]